MKRLGDPLAGGRAKRPDGLSEAEVFAWFCPGEPPDTGSLSEGCWDWPGSTNDNGYGTFNMNGVPTRAHVVAHRIYNVDDPLTDERPRVLHSCDRPVCVQPFHLRSGSMADNTFDARSRWRLQHGEGHHNVKLTERDVVAIRASRGLATELQLASRFGVARTTIADVLHRRTWVHL